MNKMKICIVSREYPPETLWGGIGTFTYNLAHGLKNIGHDVDVVCFTLGQDTLQDDEGITIHRISSPKIPLTKRTWWDFAKYSLFPFSFLYSYKIMKKIDSLYEERRYDVIDFPEHIGEGFFSIFFQRWPSLVRLYTPLSLIGELGLKRSTNLLDYFLFGIMEKLSIKKATIVNSPSSNLAALVADKFKFDGEISILYNPIDTDKFAPKEEHPEPDSDMVNVLFAGRLEDRKGAHVLAHAMKDYIVDVLSREGGGDSVQFVDPVPYHLLVEKYQAADIMVVPSLYDNSPYTCLEAMSCGVPVIGTSAGGMPEYIDDGVSGLIVPPKDPDALAQAIINLVDDSEKRHDFGRKARSKALTVFKREVIAEEITKLYSRAKREFSA
jgi:glycosyltransferase involved in cell wall biosynthesis